MKGRVDPTHMQLILKYSSFLRNVHKNFQQAKSLLLEALQVLID